MSNLSLFLGSLHDFRGTPQPFPGKYPTRIIISDDYGNSLYVGKPDASVGSYIRRKCIAERKYPFNLRIQEFDQGGKICSINSGDSRRVSSFVDLYFPMPFASFLNNDTWITHLLNRELVQAGSRFIYLSPWCRQLFSPLRISRMIRDLSNMRVSQWFTVDERLQVSEAIVTETDEWIRAIRI